MRKSNGFTYYLAVNVRVPGKGGKQGGEWEMGVKNSRYRCYILRSARSVFVGIAENQLLLTQMTDSFTLPCDSYEAHWVGLRGEKPHESSWQKPQAE